MGKLGIGMNLEAIRRHEKPFEWGVEKAAELGFSRAKFREADPHIDESAAPSLNCHLERTH